MDFMMQAIGSEICNTLWSIYKLILYIYKKLQNMTEDIGLVQSKYNSQIRQQILNHIY
jgi:hypothetical protein